jgi:hypothetical protein
LIDSQNEDGFELLGRFVRVIAPVGAGLSVVFLLLGFAGSRGHIVGMILSWSVYALPFLSVVFLTSYLVNRKSPVLNRSDVIVGLRAGYSIFLWGVVMLAFFAAENAFGLLLVFLPFIIALGVVNWILYTKIRLLEV